MTWFDLLVTESGVGEAGEEPGHGGGAQRRDPAHQGQAPRGGPAQAAAPSAQEGQLPTCISTFLRSCVSSARSASSLT
jgi:hypothetical protein